MRKKTKNVALHRPNTTLLRIEIADTMRILIHTANTMVNYSLFYFNLNIYIICFEELYSLNNDNLRRRK